MIGRRLGHYEILDVIREGGMGVVYRARDRRLKRDVAVKVLKPEFVADRDRRRRFVQEAQAAAALQHPNIATIFDVGDRPFRGENIVELLHAGSPSSAR